MKNKKHTKGPWEQSGNLIYATEGTICELSELRKSRFIQHERLEIGSVYWDEQMANARLIAAAPEMYESIDPDALDAIADEIDGFEHSARADSLRVIARKQRAAVAKVEEAIMTTRTDEIKAELEGLDGEIGWHGQCIDELESRISRHRMDRDRLYSRRATLEAPLEREEACLVKPQPVGVKLDGYDI